MKGGWEGVCETGIVPEPAHQDTQWHLTLCLMVLGNRGPDSVRENSFEFIVIARYLQAAELASLTRRTALSLGDKPELISKITNCSGTHESQQRSVSEIVAEVEIVIICSFGQLQL